jgi:hypothetical protein
MAIAATATALALATAGCSGGGSKGKGSAGGPTTPAGTSPDSVASAFLAAWQAGDYDKAASYTDDAAKSGPRLKSVMTSLAPKSVSLSLGPGATVTPTAAGSASSSATPSASAAAASGPSTRFSFDVVETFDGGLQWKYESGLTVLPGSGSTPPLVHWGSAVIHPELGPGANLKAVPPTVPVTDDKGVPLSAQQHPTLATLISKLSTASPQGGSPSSLQVEFVDLNTGNQIPNSDSFQLGDAGATSGLSLKSTIDSKVQSAAEQALTPYPDSGMVVIQPSTGDVLAIASNSKTVAGLAYHATRAPGSTFKTVTATALMSGGMKISDSADCTPTATVGTEVYHNDEGLANGFAGATLLTAYEQSCNTSFVNASLSHLSSNSALSDEAKNFFGMNQPWNMGIGQATYCTVGEQQVPPATSRSLFAASAFGQGNITMCPLTMASVAATVAAGQFHQPVLIPGFQGPAKAQPLPADVDSNLKYLMQHVITNGTATSLANISPTLGAKTGSAEHDGQSTTDSWMIAMDPSHDIAVCALVLNGGFGNSKAGPAIAAMMHAAGLS